MVRKYVETVLGPIDACELGRVLTHEHLIIDFETFFTSAPTVLQKFVNDKITIGNLGVIKQYPYSSKYNICLNENDTFDAVLEDVKFYKSCGGGSIVENTNYGIKRNVSVLEKISRESGVHVIAGTGHYVAQTQSASTLKSTEEQMYDLITKELTVGCDDYPSVKAGFIGEVGSTWPIEDFEKRAIRATAHAQEQLKCSVSFHPGRNPAAPFEVLRTYMEAGGDVKKAIMSHLDRTLLKDDDVLQFAELGSYCQYDLFGNECSYYQFNIQTDMPSDAQRLDKIRLLKDNGKLDKILMSHDIHTKHSLMNFGGHGYSHIQNNVIPKMFVKGFTKDEINAIMITNPKNWLTF